MKKGPRHMIISFGWTTPALIAGKKTVTRRAWTPKHAAHFKAGMLADAWNTSPRNVKGNPHKVAVIRLTADPYSEMWKETSAEYDAEGFSHMDSIGLQGTVDGILLDWEEHPREMYVVRFEVVEYLEGPLA